MLFPCAVAQVEESHEPDGAESSVELHGCVVSGEISKGIKSCSVDWTFLPTLYLMSHINNVCNEIKLRKPSEVYALSFWNGHEWHPL